MAIPNQRRPPDEPVSQLVDALHDMRDALVNTSLVLQDVLFDFDSVKRGAATEHSKEWIEKVKNL